MNTDYCPFCDLKNIQSEITDYGDVVAFEPLNPVTKGHELVVPKEHVEDFTGLSGYVQRAFEVAARRAKANGGSYNLITSKGIEATQTVFHFHIHLIPRREADGLALPWTNHKSL